MGFINKMFENKEKFIENMFSEYLENDENELYYIYANHQSLFKNKLYFIGLTNKRFLFLEVNNNWKKVKSVETVNFEDINKVKLGSYLVNDVTDVIMNTAAMKLKIFLKNGNKFKLHIMKDYSMFGINKQAVNLQKIIEFMKAEY